MLYVFIFLTSLFVLSYRSEPVKFLAFTPDNNLLEYNKRTQHDQYTCQQYSDCV